MSDNWIETNMCRANQDRAVRHEACVRAAKLGLILTDSDFGYSRAYGPTIDGVPCLDWCDAMEAE